MRKYFAALKLGWVDAKEYRTEFFINIFGWGIRLVIAVFLWIAVAKSGGGTIGGYSTNRILQYFFFIQIISGFVFSRVGFEIAQDIYKGDFANFLLKPINYILFRMTNEISKNFFRTGIALAVFGGILAFSIGDISLPLWKIPLIIITIIGSYLVNFCLVCSIALSAFWIVNAMRLTFVYFGILTIFSGMVIPTDLFPPQFLTIFKFLPFPYIFFFPVHVIQAPALTPEIIQGIFIQWAYVLLLMIMLLSIYKLGVKRFEAVGR